ncbi:hypothetical protein LIER_10484 [Lithospermum erythrorhizon]|uniref:Reverse transcriptase domain-containing protein n=1 Tax=Lithospermum erythrorhizon TaxID=34254 RepID=A0AAV3PPG4_LITER
MKKGKVPGLDGLPASFYEFYWDMMAGDVCDMILKCVNDEIFLKKFNFTLISLIPKVPQPSDITQFRHIALCNTTAKLIARLLAERGLRQGNPLSPYLFIICTEGLISLLNGEVSRGSLSGICLGQGGKLISRLLFADDTVLFGEATQGEARSIMSILQQYEVLSGQRVSVQKSAVMFSPNVGSVTWGAISNILGMREVTTHGTYLGLPSSIGSSKKDVFSSLIGRVKNRIEDWKPKLLSKAGKFVFITSVLQAVPTLDMQYFKLPIHYCHELYSQVANYWWGSTDNKGGLGFRDNHVFNIALLSKQAWRIVSNPSSELAQMFRAKYYPHSNFWNAFLGQSPSLTWKSLLTARDLLIKGKKWTVCNGKSIKV